MNRSLAARRFLLLIVPVVAAIAFVLVTRDDPIEPMVITAASDDHDSLAALINASDSVVVARAESVGEGRVIGSDNAPDAAIRTQLVTMAVGDTLHGVADSPLVLEQPISLADGTPVLVNGVPPTKVGDEGIYFLQRSDDPQAPYVALVNDQSRYLVAGPARDQLSPSHNDPMSNELAALGPYELRCQVLANGNTGRRC